MNFWVGEATAIDAVEPTAMEPLPAADAMKPFVFAGAAATLELAPLSATSGALGRAATSALCALAVACAVATARGNAKTASKAPAAIVRRPATMEMRIRRLDLSLMRNSLWVTG
jgi:hypothetical protein